MLCHNCKELQAVVPEVRRRRWRDSHRTEPLDLLFCERCRALLLPEDTLESMLSKLGQMSRFGLGADDRPLLTRTERRR
jgi:hypothetical protein